MTSFRKEFSLDKFDLSGKLIGIFEEPNVEGNFAVNYFIWESLREQNSSCCLLTLKHTFNHYFHVGLKLGYNLTTQKSRAIVYEALGTLINQDQNYFSSTDETNLKNLFFILKKETELLLEKYENVFLIIDDISILLSLGFQHNDIIKFCHYLRTFQNKNITVIVLIHFSEDDKESLYLKSFFEQNSDIKFFVSSLKTGTAQDVTGSIKMTVKSSALESFTNCKLCHYKLTDRNIKVFPPGFM
ncbi:hypothetical protein O3M35_011507 [Rhynocoris fuscipes]|uniref:Elongator complex protein 6 n=1 Tax=Rhynocoris fuscipes TaxID=488301 RepID=A0AAW1D0Z7_9HEMI